MDMERALGVEKDRQAEEIAVCMCVCERDRGNGGTSKQGRCGHSMLDVLVGHRQRCSRGIRMWR